MVNDTTPKPDTQEALARAADELFEHAFQLGCEAEELRHAYVTKMHELRKAQQAHAQAVDLLTRYALFLEK